MEVITVTSNRGDFAEKEQLVYAHEHTNFNITGLGNEKIHILAWTHPIVQLALSGHLKEESDIRASGYTLTSVKPLARAKFSQVIPEIAGLYEPGGQVKGKSIRKKKTGLKAVKLDMTKDQVDAFLSKMNGMMLVRVLPAVARPLLLCNGLDFCMTSRKYDRKS